jgi:hypothetical protein
LGERKKRVEKQSGKNCFYLFHNLNSKALLYLEGILPHVNSLKIHNNPEIRKLEQYAYSTDGETQAQKD